MHNKPQMLYDIEAEAGVIGSIMLDSSAIYQVMHLDYQDFFDTSNQVMFRTLRMLFDAGKPVTDVSIILSHLRATGELEKVGGSAGIARVATSVTNTANVAHYASIVLETSRLRKLVAVGEKVIHRAYDRTSPDRIISEMDAMLQGLGTIDDTYTTTLGDEIDRILDNETRKESGEEIEEDFGVVPTGIAKLDEMYQGVRRGQMVVIAARPSDGKSALGKQIASNVSESGTPVLFVTLEMEKKEVADRVLSQRLQVDGKYIESGVYHPEQLGKLVKERDRRGVDSFWIHAPVGSAATWNRIAAYAQMMHATKGIGLLVVDYLQLVEKSHDREMTYDTVTAASRGAKKLARKLKIPVVCLAQVGRDSDKGSRRPPRLSDLRDSGAIEQDADAVLFLHRDFEDKNDFTLVVAKWRNGQKASIPLSFCGRFTLFEPREELS